jgi:hypothetical protein
MMLSSPSPAIPASPERAPEPIARVAWLRYRTAQITLLALPFTVAVLVPFGAWQWGQLSALVAVPLALLALGAACEVFARTRCALARALARRLLRQPERLLRATAAQQCPKPLLLHSWHDGELGCAALDGASEGGALFLADRESGFAFARIGCEQIVGLQYLRGAMRNLIVVEFFTDDSQRARRHLLFVDADTADQWNRELRRLLPPGEVADRRQA